MEAWRGAGSRFSLFLFSTFNCCAQGYHVRVNCNVISIAWPFTYVHDNSWHRSLFKIKPVTLRGWWGSDKARHMNRKATQIWLVNVATRADKMRLRRLADLGATVLAVIG